MFERSLPVLGVSSSAAAVNFYRGQLRLRRKYASQPPPGPVDPGRLGGNLELGVVDLDGNRLCFAQDKGA